MVSTFEFAGHVVGIIISSDVDKKLLKEVHQVLLSKFKEHQRINIFVEIHANVEIPIHIILKDLFFKLENDSKFGKIAVVSSPGLFKNLMKVKDLLMKAEVEAFSHEERIKAMNWVSE